MPIVIFDTGFLYSLVVDSSYSEVAREVWADRELWVPPSVLGEVTYRQRKPLAGLSPELPQKVKGLLGSSKWSFDVKNLSDDESAEAELLREQIGDADPAKNRAECEAAVLLAGRAPAAGLRIDDRGCLPVVARYVQATTGSSLSYATTSDVLDALVREGHLAPNARASIRQQLVAKNRPFT
ncbi:MAG: hypothetical protein ABL966_01720 [Acidimicrobiales bacterium]